MTDFIVKLLVAVISLLDKATLHKAIDALLDVVEDKVKDSSNVIDDALVLPLCAKIRDAFGIEDND